MSYTWDARGNLRSNGVFTYTYDGAGHMVRAESVSATVVYTCGLDSLLVGRSAGGAAATYAWDWATGVPEMLSDGERLYLIAQETLGWADGAEWSYPLGDALGSVRQVVDGAGEVLDDRSWTPFGVEKGTAQGGLGYTSEWWDAEVSLLYLRARWYDPTAGRFTTEDPWKGDWERPQTLNPYEYVEGNVVNTVDPAGLCTNCKAGDVVTVQGTTGYGGLKIRVAPSMSAKELARIPEGAQVMIGETAPVEGDGSDTGWHSVIRVNGQITWIYLRLNRLWTWVANDYLADSTTAPDPFPSPTTPLQSSSNLLLPMNEPIKYLNAFGYYDWAYDEETGECGCRPEQSSLDYPGSRCGYLVLHNGWDMISAIDTKANPEAINVYAMAKGTVSERVHDNETNMDYLLKVLQNINGKVVEIQYTHIAIESGLEVGTVVEAGQKIGTYGAYGYRITYPHLHISIKEDGRLVDPALYWPSGKIPSSFSGGNPLVPYPSQ